MNTSADTIEISDPNVLALEPLVSVCMLAYQHEKFIADAVEGVIAQKCDFPIELIIGEDNSPDNTRTIVFDYQRRYSRLIRVLTSERNVGAKVNTARCRGAARGKYIAICEGDDYWICPSKLRRQVDLFAKRPRLMLVGHSAEERDANTGKQLGIIRPAFSSRILSMHELILGDGGLIPSVSVMFRREAISDITDWQAKAPISDYPLVLQAGLLGEVASENRVMAVYRCNVPGSWSLRRGSSFEERWRHARAMQDFLSEFDVATQGKYALEVRQMISKYLSDALVRYRGDTQVKRAALASVLKRLSASDRMFAILAMSAGTTPAPFKTILRKLHSLSRTLYGEFAMPPLTVS